MDLLNTLFQRNYDLFSNRNLRSINGFFWQSQQAISEIKEPQI